METTAATAGAGVDPTKTDAEHISLASINAGGRIRRAERASTAEKGTLFGRPLADTGNYVNPHVIRTNGYTGIVAKFADGNIAVFASRTSDRTAAFAAEFAEADTIPYKRVLKANAGRGGRELKLWSVNGKLHLIIGGFAKKAFTKIELCVPMVAQGEVAATQIAIATLDRHMNLLTSAVAKGMGGDREGPIPAMASLMAALASARR